MNSIYNKNIKLFEKLYPIQFEKMISGEFETSQDFTVKTESFDDNTVIYLEYPDRTLQLQSLYDDEPISDIWADNVLKDLKFRTKIFMFGLGNVSIIRKLIEKIEDDNHIIIHEPDFSILKPLMEVQDITDIINSKRCTIIVGNCLSDSVRNAYELFLDYTEVYNFIQVTSLNYNYIFPKEYKEYISGLEMAFSTVASDFKYYSNSGRHSNRNVFKNIKYMMDSKSLEDFGNQIDNDIPAIIVAAGPSLSKNIQYLKEAKGKAVIICIDAAMRALARAGITPDLCVTVDFNKELGHFDEGDSNSVPMICSLISTASIVENNKATKLFYREITPYINDYFDDNNIIIRSLPTGGTVANNALSAAIHMGCKTIIMIGQDLAYSDNRTHAAGTVKGDSLTVDSVKNLTYVEDMDGNLIPTCGEFVLYKQWIEETVAVRDDVHFINATEGGAGLKGCEHITLKEAIDRECKKSVDVKGILDNTKNLFDDNQKAGLIEYVSTIPEALRKIEKEAKEGYNCYSKMINMIEMDNYNSSQFIKLFKKTKSINKRIDTSKVAEMVFNEIQEDMNKNMQSIYNIEKDEKQEILTTCSIGRDSFERILTATKELTKYVEEQIAVCFN